MGLFLSPILAIWCVWFKTPTVAHRHLPSQVSLDTHQSVNKLIPTLLDRCHTGICFESRVREFGGHDCGACGHYRYSFASFFSEQKRTAASRHVWVSHAFQSTDYRRTVGLVATAAESSPFSSISPFDVMNAVKQAVVCVCVVMISVKQKVPFTQPPPFICKPHLPQPGIPFNHRSPLTRVCNVCNLSLKTALMQKHRAAF